VFRTIADGLRATGREVAGTASGRGVHHAGLLDGRGSSRKGDRHSRRCRLVREVWVDYIARTQERGGQLGVPVQLRLQVLPVCSGDRWARLVVSKDAERGPGGKVRCDKDAALPAIPLAPHPFVAALLDDAEESFRENRIEEAVKSARAAVRAGGGTRARLVEGRILFGAERLEESEAAFAAILQLTPTMKKQRCGWRSLGRA